ncbi:MAG: hypothetical protein FWC78_02115 [Defluviitaleaceae bacterium]|nr:hypothetical protein [Defluviitaleaceae bacterium]
MDRVPYRRVTVAGEFGRGRKVEEAAGVSGGETVIVQCIFSAVLLVFVLLVGLVDLPPAAALRNGINEVLVGANTPGELASELRRLTGQLPGGQPQPLLQPDADIFVPPTQAPVFQFEIAPAVTAYEEASNPQIPGPSPVPELWD